MIELYRAPASPLADEIEEALREVVVAHRVVTVGPGTGERGPVPEEALPALREGDEVVTGEAGIRAYLASLRALMEDWNGAQADVCHMDRKGRLC
jgi:hypothetical protein